MSKIAVIIPTLVNSPQLLSRCLESLADQTLPKNSYAVFLVGSPENKLKLFYQKMSALPYHLSLIISHQNKGFTGAVNLGIDSALKSSQQIQHFVLLNDDAWVERDFLERLLETQKKFQSDMVAATIYKGDTSEIDSCGIDFCWRGKAAPLKLIDDKLTSSISDYPDNWTKNQQHLFTKEYSQPFGPDAAAGLYTSKLLSAVGHLDENFFAYLEDVDLAIRARRYGFICAWSRNAIAHHAKHSTSQHMGKFKQKQDIKNWWRIVLKYPSSIWVNFWPQILFERIKNIKGLFVA